MLNRRLLLISERAVPAAFARRRRDRRRDEDKGEVERCRCREVRTEPSTWQPRRAGRERVDRHDERSRKADTLRACPNPAKLIAGGSVRPPPADESTGRRRTLAVFRQPPELAKRPPPEHLGETRADLKRERRRMKETMAAAETDFRVRYALAGADTWRFD